MKVVFECERMRYPFTGLYEYCNKIGSSLQKYIPAGDLTYYVPENLIENFGDKANYIQHRTRYKILPVPTKADVWHSTYQLSKYIPSNKKVKNILTIHDLNFLYEDKTTSKEAKYLKKIQTNIDKADRVVMISEFVKNDVLTHLNLRDKPMDVIYNGCDVLTFEGYATDNYKPQSPFLFSIATVLPKKNFHILPCLLQGNELELIIAGKENLEYKDKIIEEAKRFGVQDRLKFVGAISAQDKYWYLKNCMAFMFPSLAEGFGIPVVEAMSFGKPTFISTHTSLPEIGGERAYYFENFEPEYMQSVLEIGLRDYRENEREQAIIQHASQFTWDKCAEQYSEVYKKVLL